MQQNSIIQDDFLLKTPFARRLYHTYARDLPIVDYHNHLPPEQIAGDHRFDNITQAWLAGDHYKWRAMRTLGIAEEFITGKASDHAKFLKWAETVPYTIRNPLYHWTLLELKRYFNIDIELNSDTADLIFEQTSGLLRKPGHSTLGLLQMMKVEVVCTTDDPADTLEHHKKAKENVKGLKVLPAFRPDNAYTLGNLPEYREYLKRLEMASGRAITSFLDLLTALENRIDYFHANGCRLADHGLEHMPFPGEESEDCEKTFIKLREEKSVTPGEISDFTYRVLLHLCSCYHQKGWVQQFHLGALRNTNSRLLRELGANTGFDSIGDFPQARALSNFLNKLEESNSLAKTILYNVNPSDNEVFATMAGNFSVDGSKGKIQWGSAWWFMDQKEGMEKQLNTLSNMGLLSCFVGMLTDSRSFLSFPRHEYFRRILCNLIGNDVAGGELPEDEVWLGKIVQDICYHNAVNYFPF
jgi:glucuronate isomerase